MSDTSVAQQHSQEPGPLKRPFFRRWFHSLVLVAVAGLLLCSTLLSNHVTLFDWSHQVVPAPPPRPDPRSRSSRVQFHQAYPRNYRFTVDVPDVCRVHRPFLVMMVPVAPADVAARDAVRQTWGKEKLVRGKTVLTLFVSGRSETGEGLGPELSRHRDLIQSDFVDSYLNLTIKTMVIMEWLTTRCPEAQYAMKVDSDMFINVNNLVSMLTSPTVPKTGYLTGRLMRNRPVVRSRDSKWYVPEQMFPAATYPTYTLGMAYVFSNDLPPQLVEVCKSVRPFNIEDAYIGMCMKKLGLTVASPPDPGQFQAYNSRYDRCEFSRVITYILQSPEQLISYWTDLNRPGPPC